MFPKLVRVALLMVLFTACAELIPPKVGPAKDNKKEENLQFAKLIEDFMEFRRKTSPLLVPDGVDNRYSKRMEAISQEYFLEKEEAYAEFLRRLSAIDPTELSANEKIDAEILDQQLRDRLGELRSRYYRIPIGSRSGFHIRLVLTKSRAFMGK